MAVPSTQRLRMPSTLDEDAAPEPPGAEELKQRLVNQAGVAGEVALESEKPKDPKLLREFTFPFHFEDGNGRVYAGSFTNRILSTKQRMLAGALTSDLVQGRPVQGLAGATQQLAIAIGWMSFSLVDRPEWARDLAEIEDDFVVLALFGEVWSHQSTFLGRKDDTVSTTT